MLWGQASLWSSVVDCMLSVGLLHTIGSITLIKLICDKTVSFHWIALEFECCHWLRGGFLGVLFGNFYFLEGLRLHLAIPRRILIFMRNGFGTLVLAEWYLFETRFCWYFVLRGWCPRNVYSPTLHNIDHHSIFPAEIHVVSTQYVILYDQSKTPLNNQSLCFGADFEVFWPDFRSYFAQ